MKRSAVPILLFLFVLQCALLTAAAAKITVEEACKKAGGGFVDEGFCLQALNSVPGSRTADEWGLLSISLNLSLANATSTASKLQELVKVESDAGIKNSLEGCHYIYSNSGSAVRSSLGFAVSKDLKSSVALLRAAQMSPTYCENALPKGKLTKENENFSNLLLLATAITTFFPPPQTV